MWRNYQNLTYHRLPLQQERRLIAKAQKGSKRSKDEIILRHIGFLRFRIHKIVFSELVHRFGEDLLGEAILIVYKKIKTYDLDYCDKQGNPKPVKFVSYIWKRIDGFILDYLKKEMKEPLCNSDLIVNLAECHPQESGQNLTYYSSIY